MMENGLKNSLHTTGTGSPLPGRNLLAARSAEVHEGLLFAADPMNAARSFESAGPVYRADPTMVKSGTESGMTRYCEQSFVNPESARVGSQTLLATFNDSGLWLASLVQPPHLVAELRQQCCLLTRVIVTQWTRQGETHKLVKLAEALQSANPPVLSHEAGQIMALLASLLGILRPVQAPRWLDISRPLLKDSVDPHLLREARQWVNVGQLLLSFPPEDRLFWNRRLRDPEVDWDWESPEALDALARLAVKLPAEHESLPLFEASVPRCWWELWREKHVPTLPTGHSGVKSIRPLPILVLGLIVGMTVMFLATWWSGLLQPNTFWATAKKAPAPVSPSFSFHEAQPVPAAPVNRAARLDSAKKPEVPHAPSAALQMRMAEVAKILAEFPALERLHGMVKTASLREAEPHIQGRTMIASQRSKEHRALLRWLMLDPPNDREVRALAGKAAVRDLGSKEMFDTLQLCLSPDSPNLEDARECASLLLDLGAEGLTAADLNTLTAQVEMKK